MSEFPYDRPKSNKEIGREAWLQRQQYYWRNKTTLKFNTVVGEIYEVDFGENIGSEFSGRHLALCLSDTTSYNDRVLVIPLTTKYEMYNIQDVIETTSYVENKPIKAGVVINEARYISKMRIFKTSIILKESEEDKRIPVGKIKLTQKQLTKFRSFVV